jgi:hypothetical protein
MSTQQNTVDRPQASGPRPDLRLCVRFRYYCDQDLILALQRAPNENQLIRTALRWWLLEQENVTE